MITTLKLLAAGMLGWALLNPGSFLPRADKCECKANAAAIQPRADTCECKAKSDSPVKQLRAENCECKAKKD